MTKKIKTCVLHVGMPKTGTTAIQRALYGYDDGSCRYADLGESNHSVALNMAFGDLKQMDTEAGQGSYADHAIEIQKAMREKVAVSLSAKGDRVVFSGENIWTMDEASLRLLRNFLLERSERIQLVLFVRDPLTWAASWTQQVIKQGLELRTDVISAHPRERYTRLARVFGAQAIEVFRYEDVEEQDGDAVTFFARHFGLDPEKLNRGRAKENPSLPEATTQAVCRIRSNKAVLSRFRNDADARRTFLKRLNKLVDRTQLIDARHFANAIDPDDYDFLNALLKTPYARDLSYDVSLETYLNTVDDGLLEKINGVLMRNGCISQATGDPDLALSLFFAFVVDAPARPRRPG